MSEVLPRAENASPLVRSQSELDLDQRRRVVAAPHGGPEASPPAGFGRIKTLTSSSSSSLKAFDDPRLQLSERESIFATTYSATDSNAATPRQNPLVHSKNDPAHNVATHIQLPPSLLSWARPPASSPTQAFPPSAVASSSLTHKQRLLGSSRTSREGKKLDGRISSLSQREDSQNASRAELIGSKRQEISSDSVFDHTPNPPKAKYTYDKRMSSPRSPDESSWRRDMGDSGPTEDLNTRKSINGQNFGDTDNGRSHGQDQQIEATIASEERMSRARSRKASHYLGLFRERTDREDRKKSRDHRQEQGEDERDKKAGTVIDSPGLRSAEALKDGLLQRDELQFEKVRSHTSSEKQHRLAGSRRQNLDLTRALTLTAADTSPLLPKDSVPTSESDEDLSSFAHDSIEWRSGIHGHGSLPFTLLEEIRGHRWKNRPAKPKTPLEYGNQAECKIPETASFGVDITSEGRSRSPFSIGEHHCEEEEDSDKERISSATYYPHQAPSPDTLADHQHYEEVRLAKRKVKTERLPPQTLDLDAVQSEVIRKSSDPALSLQSKDGIHYLEREYQNATPALDVAFQAESRWSTASSASDTDYESLDEGGRSDRDSEESRPNEDDVTPTQTPNAYSYLKSRSRHQRKPLRAVELQPYKHQVGGHTKVFSFSKQAICKQLNNRENVFYEVVERKHRQLLHFLPR